MRIETAAIPQLANIVHETSDDPWAIRTNLPASRSLQFLFADAIVSFIEASNSRADGNILALILTLTSLVDKTNTDNLFGTRYIAHDYLLVSVSTYVSL